MTLQIDDAFIGKWEPEYDRIADDEDEYRRIIAVVRREMKALGTISKQTFWYIWKWKGALRVIHLTSIYMPSSPRPSKARTLAEDEYDSRYAEAFRRAASEPPERKLGALIAPGVKLPGVEAATGSTIIHFMHPQSMPIIDVRTLGVLFEARLISSKAKDLGHYEAFRKAIKEIKCRCPKWTLRQIDRALFAYHKIVLDKKDGARACA